MSPRAWDMVAHHGVLFLMGTGLATAMSAQIPGAAQDTRVVVRVENPIALERHDETIALSWASLRQRLPSLAPGRIRVREIASDGELVTQLLDADNNGTPDSLLFQASFFPSETKSFAIDAVAPTITPKPRVHV
jgi:hypothetical protein